MESLLSHQHVHAFAWTPENVKLHRRVFPDHINLNCTSLSLYPTTLALPWKHELSTVLKTQINTNCFREDTRGKKVTSKLLQHKDYKLKLLFLSKVYYLHFTDYIIVYFIYTSVYTTTWFVHVFVLDTEHIQWIKIS